MVANSSSCESLALLWVFCLYLCQYSGFLVGAFVITLFFLLVLLSLLWLFCWCLCHYSGFSVGLNILFIEEKDWVQLRMQQECSRALSAFLSVHFLFLSKSVRTIGMGECTLDCVSL